MIALSDGLAIFSEPLLIIALVALIAGGLQVERSWTRARRRRGLAPGAIAYLLDGLVFVGAALVLVGAATLLVEGLASIAATVGEVIEGERVGLIILGMALALGMALVLARAASGRRTAQDRPPTGAAAGTAEVRLAAASEPQLAYAPPSLDRIDDPPTPLIMMQERWQPGATSAASVPTSFLDLAGAQSNKPARSRFALASTLLTLALVVMLVSSAVLFRHQLINLLARMDATGGGVIAAGTGTSPSQINAGVENAAANVGAAAPAAIAPTSASQPVAAAPAAPPASDAQASQKHVKSNGLNLRALPGTDQQVVAVLKQGDTVLVFTDARLIQGATWVKVSAGEFVGWVDQSLLE